MARAIGHTSLPMHRLANIAPLAYDRAGAGEPLVLVHPLGADRGVWEPVIDRLAERYEAIAMDMPGFGGSAELAEEVPATAASIALSIEATLESLGLGRAHVAGISLGGWVALEFAKSERCLSVTALCPAGFWPRPLGPRPEVARHGALALVPLLRPLLATARGRNLFLRGVVAHPERVPAGAAYRIVRAYATSPGYVRANSEMRKSLFAGFEEIDCPITLAWAEFDRLVGPPRRIPPGVETHVLRGCGHVPTWDDPEQVAQTIFATAERAAEGVAQSHHGTDAVRGAGL
jgi:pimeloyl-ACP methyl ester carboxylesterase